MELQKKEKYSILAVYFLGSFCSAFLSGVILIQAVTSSRSVFYYLLWAVITVVLYNLFVFVLSFIFGINKYIIEKKKNQLTSISDFLKKYFRHHKQD